jgi:hypothetical protein
MTRLLNTDLCIILWRLGRLDVLDSSESEPSASADLCGSIIELAFNQLLLGDPWNSCLLCDWCEL